MAYLMIYMRISIQYVRLFNERNSNIIVRSLFAEEGAGAEERMIIEVWERSREHLVGKLIKYFCVF